MFTIMCGRPSSCGLKTDLKCHIGLVFNTTAIIVEVDPLLEQTDSMTVDLEKGVCKKMHKQQNRETKLIW